MNKPGNAKKYDLDLVDELSDNVLNGKHIGYLGSSVTFGACSLEVSFVEYITKRNKTTYVKEAVSGTTLVDDKEDSYVSRMLANISKSEKFDLFVVQLSTNDATLNKPLGKVSKDGNYNTHEIIGAMEFIINYVKKTWKCPIVFYTGSYYDSKNYSDMVDALYLLKDKYDIGIIDMYKDAKFNDISDEDRALYMSDPIHPTKAGYLKWWVPKMEEVLKDYIG